MEDKQNPFAANYPLADGQQEVINRVLFGKSLPNRHSRPEDFTSLAYFKHHKRKVKDGFSVLSQRPRTTELEAVRSHGAASQPGK